MQEPIYSDFGSKSPNLSELFGDSDRYDYTKVLGQGAYGIVWYKISCYKYFSLFF